MKMKYVGLTLLVLSMTGCYGQKSKDKAQGAAKYTQTITADDLHKHLYTIASDHMEGRETG